MTLNSWAIRHNIPFEAVEDLRREFGVVAPASGPSPSLGESEAAVLNRVRLEASRLGGRLWRNNVGGMWDAGGRFVRYGLANDSARMNKIIKSSDLIGIRSITIRPNMIGWTFGQFVAREVKHTAWTYTGTPREKAQLKFIQLIAALGGDAAFATGEGTL